MTCRPESEISDTVGLLRHLLDCQAEAMREVEAMILMLLGDPPAAVPGQRSAAGENAPNSLTRQEARVLEQICRGRTNRQIARKLGITEKTAKNYVQAVLRKLRVHSRTEAALIAIRNHWFEATALRTERQVGTPAPVRHTPRHVRT